MGRSPCCSEEGLNRGTWMAEEDEILARYVRVHGEGNWRSLPKRAGLKRCGKSCRLRWLNYLRPNIKRGNISEQEEDLIVRLHKLLGNRWSLIAGRLPGRTDNEIKNYWNTTLWKKLQGRPLRAPKQRKPLAEASSQLQASADPYERQLQPPSGDLQTPTSPLLSHTPKESTVGLGLAKFGDVPQVGAGDGSSSCHWQVESVSDEALCDRAALMDWLVDEGRGHEILGDFQFMASFLDLEEWM
ncbi:unnamed protein product [Spirodela intermedia]|uniref:Uncharacterized protein n=1 Tax=Spirodela intermedia TaxID=51605 RepID=A0A7I8KUU1_SPIIN|nr:unnamed protein product [Spirodela intermedia]